MKQSYEETYIVDCSIARNRKQVEYPFGHPYRFSIERRTGARIIVKEIPILTRRGSNFLSKKYLKVT